MDLITKFEYQSKVIPGVTAIFRRFTAASRGMFEQSLGRHRARLRELRCQQAPPEKAYQEAVEKARVAAKIEIDKLMEAEGITRSDAEARITPHVEFPDDQLAALFDLSSQIQRFERDSIGQAGLRAQLVSITGLTLDGVACVDADTLICEAPDTLTDELIDVADQIARLSPTERGESPWPGTSPLMEAGPALDTTATPAGSSPPPE
jgi:hypothetical protein